MKTSTITALLLASTLVTSAYAIENVKVDGKAKLWYQTTGKNTDAAGVDMFQQKTTVGQAGLELGV